MRSPGLLTLLLQGLRHAPFWVYVGILVKGRFYSARGAAPVPAFSYIGGVRFGKMEAFVGAVAGAAGGADVDVAPSALLALIDGALPTR